MAKDKWNVPKSERLAVYANMNDRAAKVDPTRCRLKRQSFWRENWGLIACAGILLALAASVAARCK